MQLHTLLSASLLDKMVAEGFVKETMHPRLPLEILNYTPKAQFEGVWNDVTTTCRGLIYNVDTMEIVSRPFSKFFNYDQWQGALPPGPVRVWEKMDGSLGILYQEPNGLPAIATRGSFDSDQARFATRWFRHHALDYAWPRKDVTYLFEIIYPDNRIVVDYGNMRGLVLLGMVDNLTGQSMSVFHSPWPNIPTVDEHPMRDVAEAITAEPRKNREGYVVHFLQTDERVKVKHDEYKRLHHLLTEIDSVGVWEVLRLGGSLDPLLDKVPDEFYQWVKGTQADLEAAYKAVEYSIMSDFVRVYRLAAMASNAAWNSPEFRKVFAEHAKRYPHTSALFSLLDRKDIASYVWKQIKPERQKPFQTTQEAA